MKATPTATPVLFDVQSSQKKNVEEKEREIAEIGSLLSIHRFLRRSIHRYKMRKGLVSEPWSEVHIPEQDFKLLQELKRKTRELKLALRRTKSFSFKWTRDERVLPVSLTTLLVTRKIQNAFRTYRSRQTSSLIRDRRRSLFVPSGSALPMLSAPHGRGRRAQSDATVLTARQQRELRQLDERIRAINEEEASRNDEEGTSSDGTELEDESPSSPSPQPPSASSALQDDEPTVSEEEEEEQVDRQSRASSQQVEVGTKESKSLTASAHLSSSSPISYADARDEGQDLAVDAAEWKGGRSRDPSLGAAGHAVRFVTGLGIRYAGGGRQGGGAGLGSGPERGVSLGGRGEGGRGTGRDRDWLGSESKESIGIRDVSMSMRRLRPAPRPILRRNQSEASMLSWSERGRGEIPPAPPRLTQQEGPRGDDVSSERRRRGGGLEVESGSLWNSSGGLESDSDSPDDMSGVMGDREDPYVV